MNMDMTAFPRLLAVVEVDKADRIICQAEGCGHSVYKRIHVVRDNARVKVIGSECFKRLYGGFEQVSQTPIYGSSEGRRLSQAERIAILENTERLIAVLEAEHIETEKTKEVQRQDADREAAEKLMAVGRIMSSRGSPGAYGRRSSPVIDILAGMSESQLTQIRAEVKATLQVANSSANLDALDWQVVVEAEVRNTVRRRRYGSSQ